MGLRDFLELRAGLGRRMLPEGKKMGMERTRCCLQWQTTTTRRSCRGRASRRIT